jgi:hypothetical protein
LDRNTHAGCDFVVGWCTVVPVLQASGDGIPIANEAPNRARQWIEFPEVVEHCTADTVFGESFQLDVPAAIIPVGGFDQADYARGNEIFKKHIGRTPAMETGRQQIYLRHVIEDGLFALAGYKRSRREHRN